MAGTPQESNPPAETLAREFEQWQKEYYDDVDAHFARSDKARGTAAFAIWEQRFVAFLEQRAPSLEPVYRKTVKMHPATNLGGLTVHQNWKRNKGEAVEALLAQCIQDARFGRLAISPKGIQSQAPLPGCLRLLRPIAPTAALRPSQHVLGAITQYEDPAQRCSLSATTPRITARRADRPSPGQLLPSKLPKSSPLCSMASMRPRKLSCPRALPT